MVQLELDLDSPSSGLIVVTSAPRHLVDILKLVSMEDKNLHCRGSAKWLSYSLIALRSEFLDVLK